MLGKYHFLDLDEAFSHIHGNETHKELIGNKMGDSGGSTIENVALQLSKLTQNGRDGKKPIDKDKVWCDYCNKPRYTKACFESCLLD